MGVVRESSNMVMRGQYDSEEDKVDSDSEQGEVEKERVNGLVSFDSGAGGDASRQDQEQSLCWASGLSGQQNGALQNQHTTGQKDSSQSSVAGVGVTVPVDEAETESEGETQGEAQDSSTTAGVCCRAMHTILKTAAKG